MFPYLGLKASTNQRQIDERLQYHPQVFEFFTIEADVTSDGLDHLKNMIDYVQNSGVAHVVIHHPMKFEGVHNEVSVDPNTNPKQYQFMMTSSKNLIQIAKQFGIQLLIHGGYNQPVSKIIQQFGSIQAGRKIVFERLDYFKSFGESNVMFENSISPLFDFGDSTVEQAVVEHQYRLCYDTSHGFIVLHGNNQKLQESMRRLQGQVVHYHFVDSMGQFHDSLQLGKGAIDWRPLKQVVNRRATNIFEINLKDQFNSLEMQASYDYLKNLWK
ncbi:TIM barrel protein [Lentilactobacillus kefiri]|uniref:Xylose isomerase domain-containing protein TIM barrel n=3 Tax=Bacilli TaxID=91061 RepID=A0A8E1V2H8_LENKE|nr:TIM barrel protein [Lentilactobacillus kefiri]KRL75410.1 xylose isomerase domain-containing protein TIM barrel [Lentilactobacillus parakefiri DSM 10551]KRM52614.1 xylose isomerase domain-containing protein TIM barrel [Lentilactobacillus kefiri DSM 20587 = JCM 5818]MCJ2161860.1 sugar phosphate isomerase/epimerase [Lentilactobacillus kefiri]MCP9369507.1 sugar phosphate isomerase/epimerase [Lentilactobacillus kefiri]MDH5108531.1 TIM barrel protein [Lentilactobacillus kefiri]